MVKPSPAECTIPILSQTPLPQTLFHNGEVNLLSGGDLYIRQLVVYRAKSCQLSIGPTSRRSIWSHRSGIGHRRRFPKLGFLMGNARLLGCRPILKRVGFLCFRKSRKYLFVKEEDPSVIVEKQGTGQPLVGLGVRTARLWGPEALIRSSGCERGASLPAVSWTAGNMTASVWGFTHNGIKQELQE